MRRTLVLLFVFGLVAAACGSSDSSSSAPADETEVDADVEPDVELPDYAALAAEIALAQDDRSLPPETPQQAIGGYGYSRYVYTNSSGQIVPSLIEGPLGRQTRCQDLERDCSYQELKALFESGDPIPEYLNLDRATLGELVDQLGRVNAAVMSYESIDDACARGLVKSTNQSPNMGIHMIDPKAGNAATGGPFDPDNPQMVLFAKDGGENIDGSEIGNCVNGAWTGEDGYEPVGAVLNLALTENHPEGFAGDLDNWHIHYNTCISRNRDLAKEGADMGDGGASVSQEQCRNAGGQFIPLIPSWMMHAYVADGFEAQSGVFSMFNPSVWPVLDTDALEASRTPDDPDAVDARINNFQFGDIAAKVGETIRFTNSDSVPHTATAGNSRNPKDLFDSGLLGTGQSFDLSFDSAGSYDLFCVLHPDMTATVEVSE